MNASPKAGLLVPVGLLVLSLVPGIAGTSRLVQLAHGTEITPENARFFATPTPVVLHIVSAVAYSMVGAFQFSSGFRLRYPRWHRAAGRLLLPCGFIAALSALWITQYFPLGKFQGPLVADFDGHYLYAIRLTVGAAMILFLSLGVAAILQRDFRRHGAWMIRAYALGLGAGTQVFTHIPWFVFPSIHGELARTVCMAAGWAINAAVAEWVIVRMSRDQSGRGPTAHSAMLPRNSGVALSVDEPRAQFHARSRGVKCTDTCTQRAFRAA